jgi:peptidyl-tRNA hydrolase, PTH1 family
VVDALVDRHRLGWESAPADAVMARWRSADVLLIKPLTFMNLSGFAIGQLLRYFKIDTADLLVIVDEAQLELGRLRARPRGSAGGHNGLKSVVEQLGTETFPRLRIGVGRGEPRRDLAGHVLATFDGDERVVVESAVARAADAVELFASEGIGPVMNQFNRKEEKNGTDPKEDDEEEADENPGNRQQSEDGN